MRMWMCDPKYLCRNHLLGEHAELHKHRVKFIKKYKIDNYIKNNCIEPMNMEKRHNQLVLEMIARGYKHQSPYEQPDISYLPDEHKNYKVDEDKSLATLLTRCNNCLCKFTSIRGS